MTQLFLDEPLVVGQSLGLQNEHLKLVRVFGLTIVNHDVSDFVCCTQIDGPSSLTDGWLD